MFSTDDERQCYVLKTIIWVLIVVVSATWRSFRPLIFSDWLSQSKRSFPDSLLFVGIPPKKFRLHGHFFIKVFSGFWADQTLFRPCDWFPLKSRVFCVYFLLR